MPTIYFGLLIVSCSTSSKKTAENIIPINEFALLNTSNLPGPRVDNKGNIYYETEKVAMISNSGEIKTIENKLVGEYKNDTLFTFGKSKNKFSINSNGDIHQDGDIFVWNKEGHLTKNTDTTGFRISPNESSSHLCASIVFLLYAMVDDVPTEDMPVDSLSAPKK